MQEPLSNSPSKRIIADERLIEDLSTEPLDSTNLSAERQQTSTLIEFPGRSRSMPEWRKQLSLRVREVQERRAREAAEEAAAAQKAGLVSCALPSAQLELVPDLEHPVMNPIVSKALERLERARRSDQLPTETTNEAPALAPVVESVAEITKDESEPTEIRPKLTVVAASNPNKESTARKPVRVISDSEEDAVLSYIETCLSMPEIASDSRSESAAFARRLVAGSIDLILIALLTAPFAAAIEFVGGNWRDPRVIGLMGGITIVVIFAYLTLSIAFTGRTLGMRMLSLRTIDGRTGLIPTGGQSMKRAIGYILTLAPLGFGFIYALVDPDGRTVYDRFSKTTVVRG